jgi:hypothetical protein
MLTLYEKTSPLLLAKLLTLFFVSNTMYVFVRKEEAHG